MFVLVYVDDIIVAGATNMLCERMFSSLREYCRLSSTDEAHFVVGVSIDRDRENCKLWMSQTAYIDKRLRRLGLVEAMSSVPMTYGVTISDGTNEEVESAQNVFFREVIGSLMYLAITTRPDILFSVAKQA